MFSAGGKLNSDHLGDAQLGLSEWIRVLCSPFAFEQLSPLCSMAKRRRSLAGPCMLEVLPKSGHQPWKASGMADFGQRALSPLGNILGMHIPFFFLATACFFLMAISSIAELLWDTSQENKLGKLRQVATMHLGLDFVISPERLARPIQPCFAGEEDEHPEMHPDPGRDLSPFPPGDISSRVSSAAHIKLSLTWLS
ncbi:uncharacterized protein LOC110355089 isoform X2 [Columba livia]|uniref:uncharacterized protein LOC110355089 isoform X2 n=1 Tax=Columba livia TaxID=8932 RepID=UPI0031BAA339